MSAERQRRYRQRQADGVRIVRVEIDEDTIDAFREAGLLADWDDHNPNAIADALADGIAKKFPDKFR